MNRINVPRNNLRTRLAQAGTAIATLGAAGMAAAQSTVGSTAATAISGSNSQIEQVQTALLGALVLLVVFALIRRSFGK